MRCTIKCKIKEAELKSIPVKRRRETKETLRMQQNVLRIIKKKMRLRMMCQKSIKIMKIILHSSSMYYTQAQPELKTNLEIYIKAPNKSPSPHNELKQFTKPKDS